MTAIDTTAAAAAKLANRIDTLRAEGLSLDETIARVTAEVIESFEANGLPITDEARERAESFVCLAWVASIAG